MQKFYKLLDDQRVTQKYRHLPAKKAESTPWEILCVDLIGPYVIHRQGKKDLNLWCVTMIDPATGRFKIKELPDTKRDDIVSQIVEQT